jgi:hypothetical protein
MITYKVTCKYPMSEPFETLKEVFTAFNGEPAEYCERFITVTFTEPQSPADLGPLVVVTVIPSP